MGCILPDDLVEDILSRVPINDLLRFRCVRKGWHALIDDVSFMRKHYQVQYSFRKLDENMTYYVDYPSDDSHLPSLELYLLSTQQGEDFTLHMADNLKRDTNGLLPYETDRYHFWCEGCVNGIICLTGIYFKTSMIENSFLALWNPATREFKTLAFPNYPGLTYCHQFTTFAFGFDLSLSDFKILGSFYIWRGTVSSTYKVVYSLKSNSWKEISYPDNYVWLSTPNSDRYLNGVSYWVAEVIESAPPCPYVILSFNFTTEAFKVSDLPHDAKSLVLESRPYQRSTALYKESLALVMTHKVKDEVWYNLHIWVASQFDYCGAPLSWQHLFTIRPTTNLDPVGLTVDAILVNGNLQLTFDIPQDEYKDCEQYLYNHSTGEFKKIDVWWHAWFRYVESLFPLVSKRVI